MAVLDNPDLVIQLERCRSLPTPPGVAEQIIGLSSQPNSDMAMLTEVVSLDPALTVKILRMANSPLYARQGKIDNLQQAIMMFGWNGTLNLALSFSLVSKIANTSEKGLDYAFFWKRSLAAAVACKHLGNLVGINNRTQDLFLPGLLQDIGMLALDRAIPTIYDDLGEKQHDHKYIQQHEIKEIGSDHAAVGAWLLDKWNFPERIVELVEVSHGEDKYLENTEVELSKNCIEVSNVIADCICCEEDQKDYLNAAKVAEKVLEINKEKFIENFEGITNELLETAAIFELDVGNQRLLNCIVEQAKEMLLLRSMETLKTAEELHLAAALLESKANKLEEFTKKDPLTNVFNRGFLEISLAKEFDMSKESGWPLSVVMVDLDHFKDINDSYGHDCGDKALIHAVDILRSCIRSADSLYRYGGEEFVVLLQNTGVAGAEKFSERIIETFNNSAFEYREDIKIPVTASLGIAIEGEGISFDTWEDLLNIADYCMYASKSNGRNQYTLYKEKPPIKAIAS